MTEFAEESQDAMRRPENLAADAWIGKRIPVLDHGFVCLVDYMGNDAAIVQAARVSYGMGTKTRRTDRGLIRYLLRHRHTTPFEMVELKFLMRLPIFVARQIIRHRTANVNEYSARYSVVPEQFYVPDLSAVKAQSATNRQGRGDQLESSIAEGFVASVRQSSSTSYDAYEKALAAGVSRELARLLLPVNAYTEWYWKVDLHNLMHFLSLRLDPHAQEETRAFAHAIAQIVKEVVPITYEAFEDFSLGGIRLSKAEQVALSHLLKGRPLSEALAQAGLNIVDEKGVQLKSGEGVEFVAKLERIQSSHQEHGGHE